MLICILSRILAFALHRAAPAAASYPTFCPIDRRPLAIRVNPEVVYG
jgi:hypothetical protein